MNNIKDYFVHIINALTGRTARHIDDYRFYMELLKEEIELLHTKLEAAEAVLKKPAKKAAPAKKAVVKKAASTKTSGK